MSASPNAASPQSRAPKLESLAAKIGVGVLVGLSVVIGYRYWIAQGEEQLAYLTVGAEIVAFAGLAAARHQFAHRAWGRGFGAVLVTVLAAAWCGLTMIQKIDADTRQKAIAAAMERPAYQFAKRAADDASAALERQSRELGPDAATCRCPDTIRAWEGAQAEKVARLQVDRDNAVKRLEEIIPAAKTDWAAIVRGAGVEIAKLLGFMVFGLVLGPATPKDRMPAAPAQRRPWYARIFGAAKTATAFDAASAGAEVAVATSAARPQRARTADPRQLEEVAYLRTVNGKWATIWRMRKIAGRSPEAIAAQLGLKLPIVKAHLTNAEKALAARNADSLEEQGIPMLHREKATA